MFEAGCFLSLYAETPVHPGSGSTFGAIDLPIQRERHTNLPVLPASSIKGVLRDVAGLTLPGLTSPDDGQIDEVFGPRVGSGNDHAGAISVTDGRLLLFPIRSVRGVFLWATCPFMVERLRRDAALVPGASLSLPTAAELTVEDGSALVQDQRVVTAKIVLEDDEYEVSSPPKMKMLVEAVQGLFPNDEAYKFFRDRLVTHLMLLSDSDLMRLTISGTDVVTRNRLNEQKTTTGGGGNMWVQEYVPSDAFFYSIVLATSSRKSTSSLPTGKDVLKAAHGMISRLNHLQIGGDETVGRGWMRANWIGVPK